MRLTSLPGRIRQRAILDVDWALWHRATAPLRRRSHPPVQRRMLVCDLMVMIAGAKAEALFAAALRAHGYATTVLLQSRSPSIEKLYRSAGTVDFLYLDDYRPETAWTTARQRAADVMGRVRTIEDLIDLEPDGVRAGRNAVSRVVRRLRVGRLDLGDETHRSALHEALADSFATQAAMAAILDHAKPDVALFNERGYTPAGEVFDACLLRDVDVIQWFGAPQSDSLAYKRYTLDTRDTHPLSLGMGTWNELRSQPFDADQQQAVMQHLAGNYASGAWFNRQQLQTGKSIKSADDVRRQLGLDPNKKTAVVFSHILYDATFFYGRSLYPTYEEWLVDTMRCAAANPHLNWVMKVHPVNVWRSKMDGAEMEQLEVQALAKAGVTIPDHVKILPADTDINTYSLFSVIDYGLTVRGTVGIELPCFGIPVITAGTGRYTGYGFTTDPQSVADYRDLLARLHTVAPLDDEAIRLAKLYTWATLKQRPIEMVGFVLDFAARTFRSPALDHNTFVSAEHVQSLEQAPDMAQFCAFVAGSATELMNGRNA